MTLWGPETWISLDSEVRNIHYYLVLRYCYFCWWSGSSGREHLSSNSSTAKKKKKKKKNQDTVSLGLS
jgi:hypothetical protein